MKKLFLILFALLFLFSFMPATSAASMSDAAKNAVDKIKDAQQTIDLMKSYNIGTKRAEDILYIAREMYTSDVRSENAGQKVDYTSVVNKLSEITIISDQAFKAYDELKLLESEIDAEKDNIDVNQVMPLYLDAKQEIQDERFEMALDKISEAHQKIAELKSFSIRAAAISAQLGKSIKTFLYAYKYVFLAIILIPLAIYIIFRRKITRYFLNRRLNKFKTEKDVLIGLLKKVQNEYFMKGIMSETEYKVKIKRYNELLHDLDRKIAILNEDLIKYK